MKEARRSCSGSDARFSSAVDWVLTLTFNPSVASTVPGLEGGCSENLTAGKASKILFGGAVAGAVIGSMLGYTYHVNVEEQRAARCRATPTACA